MKKQLLYLLLFACSISFAQMIGDTFPDNNFTYEITSLSPNTVTINAYDEMMGGLDVVIPATVTGGTNSLTYDVTALANSSFRTKGLTSVIIPEGVLTIGSSVFDQNSLNSVVIPNSVTSIGNNAFRRNNQNGGLTNITIGSGITTIGSTIIRQTNDGSAVKTLIMRSTSPPAYVDLSNGGDASIDLIIPDNSTAAYTTAGWTTSVFASVSEEGTLTAETIFDKRGTSIVGETGSIKVYNLPKDSKIEAYSVTGQSVGTTGLSSGIYIVKVTTESAQLVKKVIVK